MSTPFNGLLHQPNLVKPVDIKMTLRALTALNVIWNYLDMWREDLGRQSKSAPSILRRVFKKLTAKETTKRLALWPPKKEFKVTLEPFEAYYLETYIRGIHSFMDLGFEYNVVERIAGEINQKLA